jgi:protein-S-isoprenylcysteine O-methyltransferase Ste14
MQREKLLRGLFVPIIFSLAPAALRPDLLSRVEPWICYVTGVILVLSQPSFPFNPGANEYRDPADRYSALAIHTMIFLAAGIAAIHFVLRPLDLHSTMRPVTLGVGAVLAVAGLSFRIWSIRTLGKCFTATVRINPDHELIQSGPYRWVRHPSYLGATAAVTVLPIVYGAWWVIPITLFALFIAYSYRIRVEERALRERFGTDYEKYAQRTGAIFPRILPRRRTPVS